MAQVNADIVNDLVDLAAEEATDHEEERSDVSSEVFGEDALLRAAARAAEIAQKQKDDKDKDDAEQDAKSSSSPADANLQEVIQELQKQIRELKWKINAIEEKTDNDSVGHIKKVLELIDKKSRDDETAVPGEAIVKIKGLDPKNVPKPDKYDMNPKVYEDWIGLFKVNMINIDKQRGIYHGLDFEL